MFAGGPSLYPSLPPPPSASPLPHLPTVTTPLVCNEINESKSPLTRRVLSIAVRAMQAIGPFPVAQAGAELLRVRILEL